MSDPKALTPEEKLQEAIRKRDIIELKNGPKLYSCRLCKSDLSSKSTAKKHLESAKHQINKQEQAPTIERVPAPSANTAKARTESVKGKPLEMGKSTAKTPEDKLQRAIRKGHVTELENSTKPYCCTICGIELSSRQTIKKHLDTSKHQKNEEAQGEEKTPIFSGGKYVKENGDKLSQAIQKGTVLQPKNLNDPYHCTVCESDLSSKQSIKKHLDTTKHKKNEETRGAEEFPIFVGGKCERENGDKLQHAIQMGHVIETQNSREPYHCTICIRNLSSKQAIKKHLDTAKHEKNKSLPKKNASTKELKETERPGLNLGTDGYTSTQDDTHEDTTEEDTDSLSEETNTSEDDYKTKKSLPKKNASTKELKETERPRLNLSTDGYTSTEDDTHEEDTDSLSEETSTSEDDYKTKEVHRAKVPYRVESFPRGHVHVFNYIFEGKTKPLTERYGAKYDSQNLETIFTDMGYKVFCHEDLKSRETKVKLNEIRDDPTLYNVDALIIFFLSHGKNPYEFYSYDEKLLDLRILQMQFTDKKCMAMAQKPKIFFANYCRGPNDEIPEFSSCSRRPNYTCEEAETDCAPTTRPLIEIPRDLVVIHASTEGIRAVRLPDKGTHFVVSLCGVLQKHARQLSLHEIYLELDQVVKEMNGKQPKWEEYRFRKFFFNPIA